MMGSAACSYRDSALLQVARNFLLCQNAANRGVSITPIVCIPRACQRVLTARSNHILKHSGRSGPGQPPRFLASDAEDTVQ